MKLIFLIVTIIAVFLFNCGNKAENQNAGKSVTNSVDEPEDKIGVRGPLNFNGAEFKLSWADHPRENYFIQEYLPEGENLNRFNQMLTVHLFLSDMELKDAVKQKESELSARKQTDPLCNYEISKNPDGNEYLADFLLSEDKDGKTSIAEFNIYHYRQIDQGNGKQAIAVYAFTKRAYDDDVTEFLKSLKNIRKDLIGKMAKTDKPDIKIIQSK